MSFSSTTISYDKFEHMFWNWLCPGKFMEAQCGMSEQCLINCGVGRVSVVRMRQLTANQLAQEGEG